MTTSYDVFIKINSSGTQKTDNEIKKLGRSSDKASKEVNRLDLRLKGLENTSNLVSLGFKGLLGYLGARELMEAADNWQNFTNKLISAGEAGQDLVNVQNKLLNLSDNLGASIETTGDLYRGLKLNTQDLNYSQQQLLTLTKEIVEANLQAGASNQQIQSGIMEFNDILEKGTLQAQQYNSIMIDMPVLGAKLKQAFLEASGGTENMREQMEKGKISAGDLVNQMLKVSKSIDDTQGKINLGIGPSLNKLKNDFDKLIASGGLVNKFFKEIIDLLDGLLKSTNYVTSAFQNLASTLKDAAVTDFSPLYNMVSSVAGELKKAGNEAINYGASLVDNVKNKFKELEGIKPPKLPAPTDFINNLKSQLNLAVGGITQANETLSESSQKATADQLRNYKDLDNALKRQLQSLLGVSSAQQKLKESSDQFSKAQIKQLQSQLNTISKIKSFQNTVSNINGNDLGIINFLDLQKQLNEQVNKGSEEIIKYGNVTNSTWNKIVSDKRIIAFYQSIDDAFNDMIDNVSGGFANVITGTESVSDAFKNLANSIIQDLIRMSIKFAILKSFGAFFGMFGFSNFGRAFSSGGSVASSVASSATNTLKSVSPTNAKLALSSIPKSNFNSSNKAININTVLNYNDNSQGNRTNDDKQLQAKNISKLITTQVQKELQKQQRTGGALNNR